MTLILLRNLALLAVLATPALAQDALHVPAPAQKVGDKWVFDDTVEKGTNGFDQKRLDIVIERVGDDTMTVGIKRDGAPGNYQDQIVGLDWSHRHIVDGEEEVTVRPFSFPMKIGQSWTIDYTDKTRRGNQVSDHVHRTYTVAGWENITVSGGTFRAMKIVAKGVDSGEIEVPNAAIGGAITSSQGAMSVSGAHRGGIRPLVVETYAELYYVPEIKDLAKSIEEQYNTDGVRVVRHTQQLVSYSPAS